MCVSSIRMYKYDYKTIQISKLNDENQPFLKPTWILWTTHGKCRSNLFSYFVAPLSPRMLTLKEAIWLVRNLRRHFSSRQSEVGEVKFTGLFCVFMGKKTPIVIINMAETSINMSCIYWYQFCILFQQKTWVNRSWSITLQQTPPRGKWNFFWLVLMFK